MTGYLAYSKAGHDRHKIYLIIREQGEYVYLADGKTKMPDHPKRKKKKHIQIIKKYARPEIIQKLHNPLGCLKLNKYFFRFQRFLEA